jgi:ABC-type branched-subunit amino acid transport system permease subunit
MGINTFRYRLTSFTLGAFFAGVGELFWQAF